MPSPSTAVLDGAAEQVPTIADIKRAIRQRVQLPQTPLTLDPLFRHETELAYRQDFLHLAVQPAGKSLRKRIKTLAKKAMGAALRWLLMRQVEFNAVLVERLRESSQALSTVDQNIQELYSAWTALKNRSDSQAACLEAMEHQLAILNDAVIACRLRVRRVLEPSASSVSTSPPTPEIFSGPAFDYFLFFNQFRGSREEVLQQQRIYVDYFRDLGEVLDIGCGRGEFVELLCSEQIPVHGIDTDPDMAEFCHELGLPVSLADSSQHLSQCNDASLGGVFMAQVAEHMTPSALAGLLQECWQKLRKGGTIAVEALNPVCPEALADFWLDPTRIRLVHPHWLHFLLENERFRPREFIYTSPVDAADLTVTAATEFCPADAAPYRHYAIVASK